MALSLHRRIWTRTSVICQKSFQVFDGFLSFPGFRKPGNLETSKPVLVKYTEKYLTVNGLRIKENHREIQMCDGLQTCLRRKTEIGPMHHDE
jgi:hypothetical protein